MLGYLVSPCFRKCPLLDVMVFNYSISAALPKVVIIGKQCQSLVFDACVTVDLYDVPALRALNSNAEFAVCGCIKESLTAHGTTICMPYTVFIPVDMYLINPSFHDSHHKVSISQLVGTE